MKIDRRRNYKIVIDTETCPMDRDLDAVVPSNMLVYNTGWAVVDKYGNVYKMQSFVNADVFLAEKEMMKSSYYAEKIPKYWEDVKNGDSKLASSYNIRKALLEDIALFNVKEIYAHNMRFDYGALNNSQRWLTKSKYRYYFPKDLEICDTLKMARDVIGKMPTYRAFCERNGYLTKRGQLRFTAEILYRFITKDNEFVEEHKALEDVLIEKEILAYCYKQHKAMRRKLFEK